MSTTTASPPAVGANPAPMLPYAGAAAGPLYVAIGAVEVIGQDGFDLRVHSLSLLANGSGGWIHVAMMVTTGLLTVVGAAGLARSFPGGTGARWAVRGLAVFGLGVAAAGPLRADPAFGFPPGTPDGPPTTVTWHGIGHLAAGGIGFLGLIVACLALAGWFRRRWMSGWSVFSLLTGGYFAISFAGIATGGGNATVNLAFTAAVILGWVWITLLMLRANRERGLP
jgi:Protein of unknown function (DUF998)